MPSEKRLHPSSFLFNLGAQIKALIVPAGFVVFGAGRSGLGWDTWLMVLILPFALVAIAQGLVYRYRFDERELVLRSGLIFRNERHVPYARIQNIDAVQNILHRLLGVAEVRIETGGGAEVEARIRVLPLAAFEEMRSHVFAQLRPPSADAGDAASPPAAAEHVLLHLPLRELIVNGLVQNRGAIVVGAIFGLAVEFGMMDRLMDRVGDESGRGMVRQLLLALAGRAVPPVSQLLLAAGLLVLFLVALRILSVAWTIARLYGFTLTRVGEDLRMEFGLFTRVKATIPLRRIQTLKIRANPLHRLSGRVSIDVDTAGAASEESGGGLEGESIAPILRSEQVPGFLREVVPGIDLSGVDWQLPHPRAFRRELVGSLIVATLFTTFFVVMLKWWALALLAMTGAFAVLSARLTIRHWRWGATADAVLLRRGWLWRSLSLARVTKIQVVAVAESPFDRRHGMARLAVDTAGNSSHGVSIPYLGRETADRLAASLAAQAARTAFKW